MHATDPHSTTRPPFTGTAPSAERATALAALEAFLPFAGQDYARLRNHDRGPDQPGHVSRLSPWIRHRLISEAEVCRAVLVRHGADAAEKFLQEVCWRTYWKGWLELRPVVWARYAEQVEADLARVERDADLQQRLTAAMNGNTGIAGFDDWAQELLATGYLHNHARMWFASIWIFTLQLPWSLGADWFLRHLLDGDPASNTLSWRWVAGLHTPGKTYLARADNIRRYSDRPFALDAAQLAREAPALHERTPPPPAAALPAADTPTVDLRSGVLLTDDDTSPEQWLDLQAETVVAVTGVDASGWRSPLATATAVRAFSEQAVADGVQRSANHWQADALTLPRAADGSDLRDWIAQHQLEQLIIPWTPCGPGHTRIRTLLHDAGIDDAVRICRPRRSWDTLCWPHARAGFFGFWKKRPDWALLLD